MHLSKPLSASALALLSAANGLTRNGSAELTGNAVPIERAISIVAPLQAPGQALADGTTLICRGKSRAEGYPFPERDMGEVAYRVSVAPPQVIQVMPSPDANFCTRGATCRPHATAAELTLIVADVPGRPGYSQSFRLDRATRSFRAAGGGLDGGWSHAGACRPAVSRSDVADALRQLNNLVDAIRFAEACAGRSGSILIEPLTDRIDVARQRAAVLFPERTDDLAAGDTDYTCARSKQQRSPATEALGQQVASQLSELEAALDNLAR